MISVTKPLILQLLQNINVVERCVKRLSTAVIKRTTYQEFVNDDEGTVNGTTAKKSQEKGRESPNPNLNFKLIYCKKCQNYAYNVSDDGINNNHSREKQHGKLNLRPTRANGEMPTSSE